MTSFADELVKIAREDEEDPKRSFGKALAGVAGGFGGLMGGSKLVHHMSLENSAEDKALTARMLEKHPNRAIVTKTPVPAAYVPHEAVSREAKAQALAQLGADPSLVHKDPVLLLGRKDFGENPGIVSHELGHHAIDKVPILNQVIQGRMSRPLSLLSPGLGAAAGYATAGSDNETVRALGRWSPLIMSAPTLLSEAGASAHGLYNMYRHGASAGQLGRAALTQLPAFATYAGHAALGTGLAHGAQALATQAEKVDQGPGQQHSLRRLGAHVAAGALAGGLGGAATGLFLPVGGAAKALGTLGALGGMGTGALMAIRRHKDDQ